MGLKLKLKNPRFGDGSIPTIPLGDEHPFSSLTHSHFETESALLLSETAHLELCNGRIGQYPSLGIVCSDF